MNEMQTAAAAVHARQCLALIGDEQQLRPCRQLLEDEPSALERLLAEDPVTNVHTIKVIFIFWRKMFTSW